MIPVHQLAYADGWDKCFGKFDEPTRERIHKKIRQLQVLEHARHLKHGLPIFVVETGQYRVCFGQEDHVRTILFVGTHKQYVRWYKRQ